jgi:hypothetical protein
MAPGQAVQQHDSFHNAVSKRKQLNMIIVDKCKVASHASAFLGIQPRLDSCGCNASYQGLA